MGLYSKYAILALGAESKGVFSVSKGEKLFVSRDFGNIGDYNNFLIYKAEIIKTIKRLGVRPNVVACDMHPEYNSTLLAEELSTPSRLIKVQHHYAHIASCMKDNKQTGRMIGVAFDGTGYGTDGRIWGGEFLISSLKDFKRAAYVRYLPMPGGDAAVMEPWRMAAVYLWDSLGDNFLGQNIPFVKRLNLKKWHIIECMVKRRINSPLTSSVGRLFDAVASILIPIFSIDREAEAAIRLQNLAEKVKVDGVYKYTLEKDLDTKCYIIDLREMIRDIVKEIKKGIEDSIIAGRFHKTIARIILDVCVRLRKESDINDVALSGGVFQNTLLINETLCLLKDAGFNTYIHKRYSTSDAGISVGQIAVASMRYRRCA